MSVRKPIYIHVKYGFPSVKINLNEFVAQKPEWRVFIIYIGGYFLILEYFIPLIQRDGRNV